MVGGADLAIEGICGGAGGCLGRAIAFPFESLKTLVTTDPNAGVAEILALLKKPSQIYQGVQYSLLEASVNKCVQLVVVTKLRQAYLALTGRTAVQDGLGASILLGYISDAVLLPFTIAMENIVTK